MTKRTRIFMAGSAAIMAAGLCAGLIAYYGGGFQKLDAFSGSTELAYVPADAAVVAYADVRSIMGSQLRQQLKQVMPDHQDDGQREFQAKTGIDIEHDIDYVVASMTSVGPDRPNGLVVARGRFDIVRLEGLAREHGATVEDYRGKRLVTSTQEASGEHFTLAFLEPGLVAVGSTSAVRHAIDANMSAQSVTGNEEMMQLVGDIAQMNNAWAVGRFDVLASQAQLPDEIRSRVPAVKWFAAAGHINGGIEGTLRAEARDEQSAQQLRDVLRGFLALAQMQAQNDPKLAAISQSLQLSGDGTTVALAFTLPAELLELIPKVHQAPQVH
jgi:hypothetical protein